MSSSTENQPKRTRLYEFDMLKGVAIFMVVMGHVIAFCIREIDGAPLFKFIDKIHMPLFFFISGWFTFKLTSAGKVKAPDLLIRARQLLLPMVVVSSLWIWYFPRTGRETPLNCTCAGLWDDTWKNGYWFTVSLFELMVIYAAISPLLTRIRGAAGCICLTVVLWALLLVINFTAPGEWINALSFTQAATYFPAFMIGALGRRYIDGFMKMVNSSLTQTVAMLLLGACVYFLYYRWSYGIDEVRDAVIRGVSHIALAIVGMGVFGPWARKAYAPGAPTTATLMPRFWTLLGKESLGIYLLHYFFLFPMGSLVREGLRQMSLGFVPSLMLTVTVSAVIVLCVLGVIKLIEPSRVLTLLLTGKYEKTK